MGTGSQTEREQQRQKWAMGQRGKTLKHWDGDLEQENIRKKKHISNTGQRERNLEIGTWSQTERIGGWEL